MKPIRLKIKGLNSFIEEQTIDFEKLTDRGLFGIFGPTGSGKSTILDGITLALYGDVARKSSNFVNTNCESASISFVFQISGATTKRYLVQREFKRTPKGIRSGKCKLIDQTEGEEVLADSTTLVTKSCQEIIGLNLDDFTRTVVLPQGKFSEFLKLDGKERRIMLERLFNLQEYGDELANKLSSEIARHKEKDQLLQGELNSYDAVNEEIYEASKKELFQTKEVLSQTEQQALALQSQYETYKQIWDYQEQLKKLAVQEKALKEKLPSITALEEKVTKGEKADKILPAIEEEAKSLQEVQIETAALENRIRRIKELEPKKIVLEGEVKTLRRQMDEEVPNLSVKKDQIRQAQKEKQLLDDLVQEVTKLVSHKNTLLEEQNKLVAHTETVVLDMKNTHETIKKDESSIEALKIDDNLKGKIQDGLLVSASYKMQHQLKEESHSKVIKLEKKIQEQLEEKNKAYELLEAKKVQFELAKKEQEQLASKNPGDQETLLALQTKKDMISEKWRKHHEQTKELERINEAIKTHRLKYDTTLVEQTTLGKEVKRLETALKSLEIKRLANKLREDLETGKACPVCGSTHHQIEGMTDVESNEMQPLESIHTEKEQKLKVLEKEMITCETSLKHLMDQAKEIQADLTALGEDFKAVTAEEIGKAFEVLRQAIGDYQEHKRQVDEQVVQASEAYTRAEVAYRGAESLLEQSKQRAQEEEASYQKILENYEGLEKRYTSLKQELGIEDFEVKNQELKVIAEKIEVLSAGIKVKRQAYERLNQTHQEAIAAQSTLKEKLGNTVATLTEKEKVIEQYKQSIAAKVEDIHKIQEELETIEKAIDTITSTYKTKEEHLQLAEDRQKLLNDEYRSILGTKQAKEEKYRVDTEKVQNLLVQYSYESKEAVAVDALLLEQMEQFKAQIENYRKQESEIRGAIQNLVSLVEGKTITEDEWSRVQVDRLSKLSVLDELKDKKAQLEAVVKKMGEQLQTLKALLDKKKKLAHQLALLSDLDKLFKGKRFVEYVATTRLKYVSIEASKRLKEISGGNYGLEADENGKFIIRDYKNGGVERDASTLSGGETFLASLALALALSSEIQLKGAAPLELFFLDEGFGTLDEHLLEVVMASLEKVHHDKLKVGIISHVEAIKARIPVKLLLTPAESGKGGSKVKIERS